jgi:hypothetical protein
MTKTQKYLESLKGCESWVTVLEWAMKWEVERNILKCKRN